MTPYQHFIEARDFLQRHRSDYELAYCGYMAPALSEFNWALDFFDVQANNVLIEHDAVLKAAIVPSPDPLRLAVPTAFN